MALMMFKVILHMDGKTVPVAPGYRPDWVSTSKPEYNCAAIWLMTEKVPGGDRQPAILQPLRPELWVGVRVGDKLHAMEGRRRVGTAHVLMVYEAKVSEPPPPPV